MPAGFVYDLTAPVDTRVFWCLNPVSADKRGPVLAATPRRGQWQGREVSRRRVNAVAAGQIRAGGLPVCLRS